MKSNYKPIGDYIQLVDERNKGLQFTNLLGISVTKQFIPSVANIIGTDMENYKIIRKNQFACSIMQVRRDKKMPVALYINDEPSLISQAYPIFKIQDTTQLLPEYLMMWFTRTEFDRQACFNAVGGVRGSLEWEDFCLMQLPIPSLEKQREIVQEYKVIQNRITLNNQLIAKLEETAQTIYRQWFVDFEFPDEMASLNEYIEFNPKYSVSKNAIVTYIEMANLRENSLCIRNSKKREFSAGSKFKNEDTLLARITPCLENGKTGFVNILNENEIAYGSTEFIVMRAKNGISPFWIYCLAKDENFRLYAISSMIGSSGRQRVHSNYLKDYKLPEIDFEIMNKFNKIISPIFKKIKLKDIENNILLNLKDLILAKMTKVESKVETIYN